MLDNHEQLRADLERCRSGSSLVEVLVHKDDRLSNIILGRVVCASRYGVELKLRDGVTVHFDFRGADIRPCHRERPLEQGWKVQSPGGVTLIFFEFPQEQVAA